jgi:hypothetical protein
MQQVSLQKVRVNFECEHCGETAQEDIAIAIENGAPICCNGDQMDMVDCEVDSKMQFG